MQTDIEKEDGEILKGKSIAIMSEKWNQRSNTNKSVAIQLNTGKISTIEHCFIAHEKEAKESAPVEKVENPKKK